MVDVSSSCSFFMASAGSQIVEKELAVDLPKKGITLPGTARAGWLSTFVDGQVSLNDEVFGTPTIAILPGSEATEWAD